MKINQLFNLIRNHKTIAISGMCKNAGKTTVLNSLLGNMPGQETQALTSIGRDGENVDIVTGTEKPGIYIKEGSIFATAEGLLYSCDVTKEILETTGMSTPLGEVVLVRALSDGNVQLAGPSIVNQLIEITNMFHHFEAERIIIDGSVGRKTLCTTDLADAVVLCTGASYSPDMDETIAETAHTCELLMSEVHTESEEAPYCDGANLSQLLKKEADRPACVVVNGAITDNMLDPLIRSGKLRNVCLVAYDATKLLISSQCAEKLKTINSQLRVRKAINLAAITINPFSAYGLHYEPTEFLRRMQSAVIVPVINVRT